MFECNGYELRILAKETWRNAIRESCGVVDTIERDAVLKCSCDIHAQDCDIPPMVPADPLGSLHISRKLDDLTAYGPSARSTPPHPTRPSTQSHA